MKHRCALGKVVLCSGFVAHRSRDDSVENLFEDDEIVGDLPNEEGIRDFSTLFHVLKLNPFTADPIKTLPLPYWYNPPF